MIDNLKTELHQDKENLNKKFDKLQKVFSSERISLPKEVVDRLKAEEK